MTYLKFYSGGTYLAPDMQMSNALSSVNQIETLKFNWFEHYNKVISNVKGEMPRPGMYQDKPCFYGEIYPVDCPLLMEGEVIIFDSSFRYKVVLAIEIRQPNDAEYKRFFLNIFDKKLVRLSHLNNVIVRNYPQNVNNQGNIFITIMDKKYRWFDGLVREFEQEYEQTPIEKRKPNERQ